MLANDIWIREQEQILAIDYVLLFPMQHSKST